MTLRKRLDRLEARRGLGAEDVSITRIIIQAAWREAEGPRAEPKAAMVRGPDGWETITRADEEPEAAFLARVDAQADLWVLTVE